MVSEQQIKQAGLLLAEAANPPAKVILFGAYARGDADHDSDLDFLVIESEFESRFAEMVRLRRTLRGLGVAADVIVMTPEQVDDWGEVRSTMLHAALTEGRVVAQAR